MWRVQLWRSEHIVKGFLFDTLEDAKMKEEELHRAYPQPEYKVKTEETFTAGHRLKRTGKIVKGAESLLQAIIDLMPPGGF